MKTNSNRSTMKWINQMSINQRKMVIFLVILETLGGLISVANAFLLRFIVNAVNQKDQDSFILYCVILGSLFLLQIIISFLDRYFKEHTASRIENLLKAKLLDAALYEDYTKVSALHSEEWINRMTSDCEIVSKSLVTFYPGLSRMIVQFIAAFSLIIYLAPKFGLVLIPVAVFLLVLTYFMRKRMKILHKNVREKDGAERIFFAETLRSLAVVHSFAKEVLMDKQGNEKMNDYHDARMKRNLFSCICSIGYVILFDFSYLFALIFSGINIINSTMMIGSLVSIITLVSQIQTPIASLTSFIPRYYTMASSGERIKSLCDENLKKADKIDGKKFYDESFSSIKLDHVSFSYQKENSSVDVLKDFSLNIHKGEKLAIVGHSGCGKSTLLKLLLNLCKPEEGRISIVDTNNNETSLNSYEKLFGYVPQENLLLIGTIKEAVSFFDEKVDEEKLQKSLTIANCDFVATLPEKENTRLGEKGAGLSLGQLQRLSIARAIYSDAPILLMDEATASLDEESENIVLENISQLENKTLIMVTHHHDNYRYFSKVLNMEEQL